MSQEAHNPPTDVNGTLSASATVHTNSATAPPQPIPLRMTPLFREPLSNHTVEVKLAAVRAAIEAGADVNQLDDDPTGHNEGRPLDACLNLPHMAGSADVTTNLPVIKMLLEHGADPRLRARSIFWPPIAVARRYADQAGLSKKGMAFWDGVLMLFEDAIERLKEKEAREMEEATKQTGS